MGCSAYTCCPVFEPQKKRFKKELTSEKSEKKAHSAYLFGFNGMEKNDGISTGVYSADWREVDTRLGRWFSVDPIVKPWESPYAGFANNPIYFSDPSGLDPNKPISNPEHGDKDRNGATYDKDLGWVLPDVEIVADKPTQEVVSAQRGGSQNSSVGIFFKRIANFLNNLLPNISTSTTSGGGGDRWGPGKKTYNPNSFWGKKVYHMDLSWLQDFLTITQPTTWYGREKTERSNERQSDKYENNPKTELSVEPPEDKPALKQPTADDLINDVNSVANSAHSFFHDETILYESPGNLMPNSIVIIKTSTGQYQVWMWIPSNRTDSTNGYNWSIRESTYLLDKLSPEYRKLLK
jgi:RHS repeat-associated protein